MGSGLAKEANQLMHQPKRGSKCSQNRDLLDDNSCFASTPSMLLSPRRMGNMSLKAILSDPILRERFRDFMARRLADGYVQCWTDLEHFSKMPAADVRAQQKRAQHIYELYFARGAARNMHMDTSTLEEMRAKLVMAETDHIARQKKPAIMLRAFKEAQEKVFQTMRFDHEPHFLNSFDFIKLKREMKTALVDECDWRAKQKEETGYDYDLLANSTDTRLSDAKGGGDGAKMDAFLESPMIVFYLREFLCSLPSKRDQGDPEAETYLDCLLEIRDYAQSRDTMHQRTRMELIIQRYGVPSAGIFTVKVMKDEFDSGEMTSKFEKPHRSIFSYAYNECINVLLVEYMADFKNSPQFEALLKAWDDLEKFIDDSKRGTLEKVHELQSDALANQNVIEHAVNGGVEVPSTICSPIASPSTTPLGSPKGIGMVSITSPQGGLDLLCLYDVLEDPLGVSLFKKFSYEHFQEENINFWMAVDAYTKGNYVAPTFGTVMDLHEMNNVSIDKLRAERARMIYTKHIVEGAVQQVNIAHVMRDHITEKVTAMIKTGDTSLIDDNLYKPAQCEVFKLMKSNLFNGFTKTEAFAFFQAKHAVKVKRNAAHLKHSGRSRTTFVLNNKPQVRQSSPTLYKVNTNSASGAASRKSLGDAPDQLSRGDHPNANRQTVSRKDLEQLRNARKSVVVKSASANVDTHTENEKDEDGDDDDDDETASAAGSNDDGEDRGGKEEGKREDEEAMHGVQPLQVRTPSTHGGAGAEEKEGGGLHVDMDRSKGGKGGAGEVCVSQPDSLLDSASSWKDENEE